MVHDRCASLDGDADRLVYFTQQDGAFQLFDGDRIAVLAALLVRSIIVDLPLPPQALKVSQAAHMPGNVVVVVVVAASATCGCMVMQKGQPDSLAGYFRPPVCLYVRSPLDPAC